MKKSIRNKWNWAGVVLWVVLTDSHRNCFSLRPAFWICMQARAEEGEVTQIVENTGGLEGDTIGGVDRKKHTDRGYGWKGQMGLWKTFLRVWCQNILRKREQPCFGAESTRSHELRSWSSNRPHSVVIITPPASLHELHCWVTCVHDYVLT